MYILWIRWVLREYVPKLVVLWVTSLCGWHYSAVRSFESGRRFRICVLRLGDGFIWKRSKRERSRERSRSPSRRSANFTWFVTTRSTSANTWFVITHSSHILVLLKESHTSVPIHDRHQSHIPFVRADRVSVPDLTLCKPAAETVINSCSSVNREMVP
jgi:hypothetical protein